MSLKAPRPISSTDNLGSFCCGEAELDYWLKTRAIKNEVKASRTYALCLDKRLVGFYSLAAGSISRELVTGSIRRNMPEPIPVMLIARLAVDVKFQGLGIGMGLLRDALLRTAQAASIIVIRAVIDNALNDDAARFYRHFGFRDSPVTPLLLLLPMSEIESHICKTCE